MSTSAHRRTEVPSDGELMRRVQGDDAEAFASLYDRLAPQSFAIAVRILDGDRDRAQDAVQDGFVSLWRARMTYRAELGHVHSWAFGIMRNRAIDAFRRHGLQPGQRREVPEIMAAPDDVVAEVVAAAEASDVQALLATLPLTQREVIVLAYHGGLSHTEIASRLTVPLGTVKGRMRLGLSNLRERMI